MGTQLDIFLGEEAGGYLGIISASVLVRLGYSSWKSLRDHSADSWENLKSLEYHQGLGYSLTGAERRDESKAAWRNSHPLTSFFRVPVPIVNGSV